MDWIFMYQVKGNFRGVVISVVAFKFTLNTLNLATSVGRQLKN